MIKTSSVLLTIISGVHLNNITHFNNVHLRLPSIAQVDEGKLAEQLSAVLGPDVGRELVATLRGTECPEEENVFGAFWRSVTGAGPVAITL